jgi:hypothetical protein
MSHEHEFYYYAAANEAGWKCCVCGERPGEPPGFSPQLDRTRLERKVFGLLDDLHNHNLVYVSNGCGGDAIVADVAERCRADGVYDQASILAFILGTDGGRHAKYWKEVSDAIIAGRDPRNRCACGALATCSSGTNEGTWLYTCSKHPPPLFDPPKKRRRRAAQAPSEERKR